MKKLLIILGCMLFDQSATMAQDVCSRSEVIQKAIQIYVEKPCNEITAEDLASIQRDDKYPFNVAPSLLGSNHDLNLKEGDLDGMTSLKYINVHDLPIKSIPKNYFKDQVNAVSISIFENYEMTSIPEDLFQTNKKLKKLYFVDNLKMKTLPEGLFSGLTALEEVILGGIQYDTTSTGKVVPVFTSFPENLFQGLGSIREISIFQNDLKTLPEEFFHNLTGLEILNLHSNHLESLSPRIFRDLKSLKELSIQWNDLEVFPGELLNDLTSLRKFNAGDNRFTYIPENAFSGLTSLKELHLFRNKIDHLPESLGNGLGQLEEVGFGWNKLTDLDEEFFLPQNFPPNAFINLQGNPLTKESRANLLKWIPGRYK